LAVIVGSGHLLSAHSDTVLVAAKFAAAHHARSNFLRLATPIRIDYMVLHEGEWCWVEEINVPTSSRAKQQPERVTAGSASRINSCASIIFPGEMVEPNSIAKIHLIVAK
jgi:hypothetical protein